MLRLVHVFSKETEVAQHCWKTLHIYAYIYIHFVDLILLVFLNQVYEFCF